LPALRCTVVIATYNRARLLKRVLASLNDQELSRDRFEVIVVNDGSTDDTQQALDDFESSFTLVRMKQTNQGPGAARNLAIRAASNEIIVSLDDDVVADRRLLQTHLEAHCKSDNLAVTGVMALPASRRLRGWLEFDAKSLQKQYDAMVHGTWRATPRQFYTANASFRRADALAAGLFDPLFRRAEDVELAYRLRDNGVNFDFLPDAVVFHEPNRTYRQWLLVPHSYGHYDVVMAWSKGREDVLKNACKEFRYRNRWLQKLARVLVGRKIFLRSFVQIARLVAEASHWAHADKVSYSAYSAIFNLEYWQGICEGVGGRCRFWEMVRGTNSTT
jgi:glycosyltransferase involved in cell wall biosynthesis